MDLQAGETDDGDRDLADQGDNRASEDEGKTGRRVEPKGWRVKVDLEESQGRWATVEAKEHRARGGAEGLTGRSGDMDLEA